MNNNIDEKLSALYDGELDANEIDEVLNILDKDTNLQKKIIYLRFDELIDQ